MITTVAMAWTQEEIDQVKAAVLALATGTRVVSITYAGPPQRSVQYHPADLGVLRTMLEDMEAVVSVSCAPRMRRVIFSKGFRGGLGDPE